MWDVWPHTATEPGLIAGVDLNLLPHSNAVDVAAQPCISKARRTLRFLNLAK